MKSLLKKFLPRWMWSVYHYSIAQIAARIYGFPGKKMIVIGVTGTKGKTSTINFMWSVLTAAGFNVGIISTANIRFGHREMLNPYHMTMPGRFEIQRLMARMVNEGCTYCLVETTSEGIKQFRHIGVCYDVAVFTNLTPEHLPSHDNDFEKYKAAKGKLFASLESSPRKTIAGKDIPKIIIANTDSEHASYYLNFWSDKKISFGQQEGAMYRAVDSKQIPEGVSFSVDGVEYLISIQGVFNVMNALPALALAREFGIEADVIAKGLKNLDVIPGRMEFIDEGQDCTVIVDYAHEKQSMTNVMHAAHGMRRVGSERVIVLLGAEGGGRDKTKRPIMGEIVGDLADFVVVSNVDPYEDDPQEIMEDIARAAELHGKVRDTNLFVIEDRREGIRKALSLATKGDIVLITGKGAEQSMVLKGGSVSWDDRVVVRELLRERKEK